MRVGLSYNNISRRDAHIWLQLARNTLVRLCHSTAMTANIAWISKLIICMTKHPDPIRTC